MDAGLYRTRAKNNEARIVLLFKTGKKLAHFVTFDYPMRAKTLPTKALREFQPVQYHGRPYPLSRAVRLFLKYGREKGITKAARKGLRTLKG